MFVFLFKLSLYRASRATSTHLIAMFFLLLMLEKVPKMQFPAKLTFFLVVKLMLVENGCTATIQRYLLKKIERSTIETEIMSNQFFFI